MFWKKQTSAAQINISDPMLVAVREESFERTLALHIDAAQLGLPGEAGVMLADIARQMAKTFDQTYADVTYDEALAEINRVYQAELLTPTEGRAHELDQ